MKIRGIVIAALLLAAPALAEHGKVGAWHLESETKVADPHRVMATMPAFQMVAIRDAYHKKAKLDYCMQAADVAADVVRVPLCTVGPTTVNGQTLQANYMCEGKLAGMGQMTITYESPEHYTAVSDYELKTNSMGLLAHTTYEAKWTGETCAAPAN